MFLFIKALLEGGSMSVARIQKAAKNYSPIYQNIEAPNNTGQCNHVEGDATAEFSLLHSTHIKLLPLRQWFNLKQERNYPPQ